MRVESETRRITNALRDQKVGIREANKAWRERSEIIREQMRLQDAVAVSWTKNGSGIIEGELITPLDNYNSRLKDLSMQLGVTGTIVNSVGANMVNWGKNMQWTGRQLTVGLTYPMALASAGMAKLAYDLDMQLTRMQKVYGDTADTTEAELGRVRESTMQTAREVAKNFGIVGEDTAGLAAEFAAVGLTGDQLQETVAETARIMTLGEIERQTAIEGTISIQKVWNKDTEQLAETFNRLNAIENRTSISTDQLLQGIPRAAGAFAQAGGSVEELASALAAMNERGVTDTPQAARAIRASIGRIADPSRETIEIVDALAESIGSAFDISTLAERNSGNVMAQFEEMADFFANLDEFGGVQAGQAIFGLDQYSRMLSLMEAIKDETSAYHKGMEVIATDATSIAEDAQKEIDRLMASASKQFDSIIAQLKIEFAEMGQPILRFVNTALGAVLQLVEGFRALPNAIKYLVGGLAVVGGLAGPLIMLTGLMANLVGSGVAGLGRLAMFAAKLTGNFRGLMDAEGRFAQLTRSVGTPSVVLQKEAMDKLALSITNVTEKLEIMATKQRNITPSGLQTVTNTRGTRTPTTAASPTGVNTNPAVVGTTTSGRSASALSASSMESAAMTAGILAGSFGLMQGSTNAWVNNLSIAALLLGTMAPLLSRMAQSAVVLNSVAMFKGIGTSAISRVADGLSKASTATSGWLPRIGGVSTRFSAIVPMLGPIALGVAGITAAVWGLDKAADNAAKKFSMIDETAKGFVEASGGTWAPYSAEVDEAGNKVESTTDKMKQWRVENQKVLETIRDASPGRALTMARQIGFETYNATGNAEQAVAAAEEALKAAGRRDLVVDLNVDFEVDEVRIARQAENNAELIRAALNNQFEQTWSEGFGLRLLGTNLNSGSQEALRDQGRQIADALRRGIESGNLEEATALVETITRVMGREVLDNFNTLGVGIEDYMVQIGKDISGLDISTPKGLEEFLLSASDKQLAQVFGRNFRQVKNSIEDTRDAYKITTQEVFNHNIATRESINGQGTLSNILAKVARDNQNAADAAKEGAGANRELGESGGVGAEGMEEVAAAAEDAAAKIKEYNSAFRSEVSSRVDNAVDVVMTQFDEQTDAMENGLRDQQEAEEEALERREDVNDKYYENVAKAQERSYQVTRDNLERHYDDLIKEEKRRSEATVDAIEDAIEAAEDEAERRIDAIEAVSKAEREQEDARKAFFDAEERRISRMAARRNTEIDYEIAMRTGNIDEAARVSVNRGAQEEQWNIEDARIAEEAMRRERERAREEEIEGIRNNLEEETKRRRDQIERVKTDSDARIEGYRNELDVRKATLEQERELEQERLAVAKENAKERFEAERKQIQDSYELRRKSLEQSRADLRYTLEQDLARLTASVPQTANQYNNLMTLLDERYAAHTGTSLRKTNEWKDNFVGGFRNAFDDATRAVADEAKWAAAGVSIMDGISRGLFGKSFEETIAHINGTGSLPAPAAATAPARTGSLSTGYRRMSEYHTGGPIKGESAPGLRRDEVPIIAQKGEYMIDRKTVKRYGEDTFRSMQQSPGPGPDKTGRMHDGGVVQPIAFGAAAMAREIFGNMLMNAVKKRDDELLLTGRASEMWTQGTGTVNPLGTMTGGPGDVDAILRGLRMHESGGNYRARSRISSAAGAYQYLTGTWNRYGGFATADQAPPEVQDARARRDLLAAYNRFGDWEKAIAHHFYPAWANDKTKWNQSPSKGNPSVRAYVDSVMSKSGFAGLALGPLGIVGATGGFVPPDGFASWLTPAQRRVNPSVAAVGGAILNAVPGQQLITSGVRPGATVKGTNRPSLHASGLALDIGVLARNRGGTAASEAIGDRIAHMFRTMTNASEVLWKTMQGGDHFNHVHAGFRNGARLTVPGLSTGGMINFDNTLANLHKGEAVLTKPLTQQLTQGVEQVASGGGNNYTIEVNINGGNVNADQIASAVMTKINMKEIAQGRSRKI